MDAPNDANATAYVRELKSQGVTAVARTCEPTYDAATFEGEGISVHEMMFADGAPPPDDLLRRWIELVSELYQPAQKKGGDASVKSGGVVDRVGVGALPASAKEGW